MNSLEEVSISFYEAVIENNGTAVREILNHKIQIPIRTITGMLVIAIENKAKNSIEAILHFNNYSKDKIPENYLDALLCFASKEGLLKEIKTIYN